MTSPIHYHDVRIAKFNQQGKIEVSFNELSKLNNPFQLNDQK